MSLKTLQCQPAAPPLHSHTRQVEWPGVTPNIERGNGAAFPTGTLRSRPQHTEGIADVIILHPRCTLYALTRHEDGVKRGQPATRPPIPDRRMIAAGKNTLFFSAAGTKWAKGRHISGGQGLQCSYCGGSETRRVRWRRSSWPWCETGATVYVGSGSRSITQSFR